MKARCFVLAFALFPLVACAGDRVGNERDCELFQFEDGVSYKVRSDAVKSIDLLMEWGASKNLHSMEIEAPDLGQLNLAAELKSLHLSAFFRPLQGAEVECQEVQRTGYTRCYVGLVETPLQLSGIFHVNEETEFDPSDAMHALAGHVKASVLDCP